MPKHVATTPAGHCGPFHSCPRTGGRQFARPPYHRYSIADPYHHRLSAQAARTQVGTLSPWSRDGTPARGITITDRAGGSCFGTAESTMRTDAWRCTTGDRILDPSFSPDSNPEDASALCLDGAPVPASPCRGPPAGPT
ncbi:hypothetical protein [Streptomyces misionensis]|uniref:hypothetical protein n=1 Tax=Streptomyces misionensis TaxID=67331 RepID=UPI00370013E0